MSEEENIKSAGRNSNNQIQEKKDEIIIPKQTIIETEIHNEHPETQNMEVHHHPHVAKKNFKEYFLEFLMIFLAVTLGFFAENIREHLTEKKIARQNLEDYRNDLQQHEKEYTYYINGLKRGAPLYDSIVSIFYTKSENKELPVLSRLLLEGQRNLVITINTPTYEQLISSGSMRFIENKDLKDSIASYKNNIDYLVNYNDRIINTINNQMGEIGKLIDMHDFWNTKKNFLGYTPEMQPFTLTQEQRNFIIAYYKLFTVEIMGVIREINDLSNSNISLTKMIDKELND